MTLLLKSFSLKFGPFERLACLLQGLQRPCQPHDERWGFGNWRRLPLARRGITFFSLGLITGNWKTSGNSVVADVWLVGRFEFWNTPTQPKESRGTERSRKRKFLWLPLGKMLKTLRIKNSRSSCWTEVERPSGGVYLRDYLWQDCLSRSSLRRVDCFAKIISSAKMNIRQSRQCFHHGEGFRFTPSRKKKKRTHTSYFKTEDKKLASLGPDDTFPC